MMDDNEQAIPLDIISSNIQEDYQIEKYFNWDNNIELISRFGPQKTVVLQLANHYTSKEVIELLLTNNALKSLQHLPYQLTSYNKWKIIEIKLLLSNSNLLYSEKEIPDNDYIEWSSTSDNLMKKRQEFREQINIYKTYDNRHPSITKLLVEIIQYYINEYLVQEENFPKDYIEILEHCFRDAIKEQNYFVYFIKAYTMSGNFYRVLNRHLALYILDYFDISAYASPPGRYRLINCLVHIVALSINNPDIHKYRYNGITYRGLLMSEEDLQPYRIGNYILNRSFVSTSKDRLVAEKFTGYEQGNVSRKTSDDHNSTQVSVLLKYTIKQNETGLDITHISSIQSENEVLILPFSVFRITDRIEHCSNMNSSVLYEIDLEECEDKEQMHAKEHRNKLLTSLQRQKQRRKNFVRLKCLCICIGISAIIGVILAITLAEQTKMALSNTSQDEDQRSLNEQLKQNQTIHQLPDQLQQLPEETTQSNTNNVTVVPNEPIEITSTSTVNESTKKPVQQLFIPNLNSNQTWKQYGSYRAGGHGGGNELNQLASPRGIYIDDDQTLYIADTFNHRIVGWMSDAVRGEIVAGRNKSGYGDDQLHHPTNVLIDKENDSLIICDMVNRRVVRWPRRRNSTSGKTIIPYIFCWDLILDNAGYLYVSDFRTHTVIRRKMEEVNETIVAGGNGKGNRLDQLNGPDYIFIDNDQTVFVSDCNNHRVTKWVKDAKEGIVVAGGQGRGNGSRQLSSPAGIVVDQLGSVYVADSGNHRVMRWLKGAQEGTIVVGGNGRGEQPNQFNGPMDLSFDQQKNLYVVDEGNNRVQKFDVNSK